MKKDGENGKVISLARWLLQAPWPTLSVDLCWIAWEVRDVVNHGKGPCPACGNRCAWWEAREDRTCPAMPSGWRQNEHFTHWQAPERSFAVGGNPWRMRIAVLRLDGLWVCHVEAIGDRDFPPDNDLSHSSCGAAGTVYGPFKAFSRVLGVASAAQRLDLNDFSAGLEAFYAETEKGRRALVELEDRRPDEIMQEMMASLKSEQERPFDPPPLNRRLASRNDIPLQGSRIHHVDGCRTAQRLEFIEPSDADEATQLLADPQCERFRKGSSLLVRRLGPRKGAVLNWDNVTCANCLVRHSNQLAGGPPRGTDQ